MEKMDKKHMKAEMAALARGKAPKKVMAAEKAEYGMKMGGAVKKAMGGVVKRQSTTSKGKAC
jgi:hypothetical protein